MRQVYYNGNMPRLLRDKGKSQNNGHIFYLKKQSPLEKNQKEEYIIAIWGWPVSSVG